jgi:hypothetical protein
MMSKIRFLFVSLYLSLFCVVHSYAQFFNNSSMPKTGDEFVGPFNSWFNAKTAFGAKGDGVTDDTRALQAAFDAAAKGNVSCTLFIPPGTYIITQTLTLNYHINVSIIGADPANTIIKWRGAAKGTMLQVDGTAYSRIGRLAFDGNRSAAIAVDQSWDGSKPYFDSGNEYADDTFIDVGCGIRGGFLKRGFAETSILRNKFIRNTIAGISLGNFNALDVWVRNSVFQDCAIGVTNMYGAGNFKLYNNNFFNSTTGDIAIANTGEFSIRGNTSVNSAQFFYAGFTGNPASIIIEGNTIIDPVNTQAISGYNQGPSFFMNNIIRSRQSAANGPVVKFSNSNNAHSLVTGNTFTVSKPVVTDANGMEYNNKVVSSGSLRWLAPKPLPGTEPHINRKVFEVPKGANTMIIQAVINQAARVTGSRPVVYFPFGTYTISNTLFIPPNADMQLSGDGYGNYHATMLIWAGTTSAPMITIAGPGKVTLRDMTLKGNASNTNILITNADQKGSRVYLQNFNESGGQTGMLVNQLDHTLVFAYDAGFSGSKKAVSVIGGPMAATGRSAEGRTIIYSGAESNNAISHEVTNGGNLVVQDTWYEGGMNSTFAKLWGKGTFIAAGDRIATPTHSDTPSVSIRNFSGKATFIADDLSGRFAVSGDGSQSRVLLLGMLTDVDPVIGDVSTPKADIRTQLSRTRVPRAGMARSGSYMADNKGNYDKAWVNDMLNTLSGIHPLIINSLPGGVSDIRLYHVMSINGAIGLDIEAGKKDK